MWSIYVFLIMILLLSAGCVSAHGTDDRLVFEGLVRQDGLQHAGSAQGVPEIAFQTVNGCVLQAGTVDGHRLHVVVVGGGGTVRVDEIA